MRPAYHAYETREKSAHRERALVANAQNRLAIWSSGDDISYMNLGSSNGSKIPLDTGHESSAFPCEWTR
jgi:hypothetical protein